MAVAIGSVAICSAVLCTTTVAAPSTVNPVASPALPLTAQVQGKGYAHWTAAWWQWAMSLPMEPYAVRDGRYCAVGQQGPVWFLAGTDGSFDAQRQCSVPLGKHLLLPVIAKVRQTPLGVEKGKPVMSCKQLQAAVAVDHRHLTSAVVLVDGVAVKQVASYRVRSAGCFPMYPKLPDDDRYVTPLAASDGYWLLLPPLSPGRHTIVVGANYGAPKAGSPKLVQHFEYVLLVGMGEGYALR